MDLIRAAATLAIDNSFRTSSLELKCLGTSFSVGSVSSRGCLGAPAILPTTGGSRAHRDTHGWRLSLVSVGQIKSFQSLRTQHSRRVITKDNTHGHPSK